MGLPVAFRGEQIGDSAHLSKVVGGIDNKALRYRINVHEELRGCSGGCSLGYEQYGNLKMVTHAWEC